MCVYRHGERPVSIKHGSRPGNEASDDGDKLYYYYHHFFFLIRTISRRVNRLAPLIVIVRLRRVRYTVSFSIV